MNKSFLVSIYLQCYIMYNKIRARIVICIKVTMVTFTNWNQNINVNNNNNNNNNNMLLLLTGPYSKNVNKETKRKSLIYYSSICTFNLRIHWRLSTDFKNKQKSVWRNAFWYIKVLIFWSKCNTLYIEIKHKCE